MNIVPQGFERHMQQKYVASQLKIASYVRPHMERVPQREFPNLQVYFVYAIQGTTVRTGSYHR